MNYDERFDKHVEENAIFLIDCVHGIYVPKVFAESLQPGAMERWHIDDLALCILLEGPGNPFYQDAWDDVLANAYYIMDDGRKETLYLSDDGDLFALPEMED